MDNESVTACTSMKHLGLSRLVLILLGCLFASAVSGGLTKAFSLQFTPAETAWLAAHPVIQIGTCGNCPPIDFLARDGVYSGIAADYMDRVAARLGVRFQVKTGSGLQRITDKPWPDELKVMVAETEQAEGSQVHDYSEPFFTDYQVIVSQLKHTQEYPSLKELVGKSVVIENGSSILDKIRQAYPGIRLKTVGSTVAALQAVSWGHADAYVGSDAVAKWLIQEHQLTNLRFSGDAGLEPMLFRFAVFRDPTWTPLLGLLNKALANLSDEERLAIRQRWLPIGIETERSGPKFELTPEEQTWIDNHPSIRLGVDPAWPPIEFITEEQGYQGVTSEYIRTIGEALNIRMSPRQGLTWSKVIELAKKGDIDLLPAVGQTSERATFLNFTEPYLTFPFVVYTREDAPFINGLEDLAGKRVAVEDAYAFRAVLERDFPDLTLVLVETPLAGLRRLSAGTVDAYTGNLAVGNYLVSKEPLSQIKVGAPTPYRFELRMGVRKDWPELIPILQKILDGMTDEDKLAIRQKWLRLPAHTEVNSDLLWQVSSGSFVILGIAGLWLVQMRRQREALRRSEERYHLAMDAVSEAVWEWDLRTDKRYFSPGFFYHLGYREQEIPTTDEAWLALLHTQDVEDFQSSIHRHNGPRNQDGQPLIMEYRVRNKQGEYVDVQSIGKVVEWDPQGNAVLRRGTLRDISAQKQVESELRKLSQAVEHSPVMVIITNIQGKIEYVNPKFTEVTGYSASEAYGRNPSFLQSGLTNKNIYQDLWQTISAGKEWRGEIQDRKKNGEIFWESISISVVRNAEGEVTHYVGIKEDITARKEAERLLAGAKEEAEQANRFKSHFLANMSHEIRTPMNAIIGLAHLVLQTDLNPKQSDYLKKIKNSAQNLLGIINDILDFSKIEAGKLEIEETAFQLDQVLENLVGLVSLRAEEKGLKLSLQRDRDVPNALIGDPLRLGQILLNLVQNAIKFTELGKVEVAVKLINTQPDKVRIAFAVSDTGIGIETERLPRLFEAFEQVDSSSSRQYGGTGLGLSICKQLVELMHGELSAQSVPGEGSSFRFVLELGLQEESSHSDSGHFVSQDNNNIFSKQLRGKVLLVEDNPTNQLVARELLESFGLQVVIADEGGAALERLRQDGFDLVLMDIQMPGMDGYAATRAIRAEQRHAQLPIIAMTAHAMEGDKEHCLTSGMNDYLSKPVDPQRLYEILQDWLTSEVRERPPVCNELPDGPVIPERFQGIELSQGLRRIGGNRRLFVKLLNDFYLHHHDCCERIGQALDEGAIQEAHLLAHTLQGVAGNIGCRKLETAARQLDRVIKRQATQEIEEQKEKFCAVAKSAFEHLASLLAHWDEQGMGFANRTYTHTPGPRNINLDIIQELFDLLRDGDPNVSVLMDSLQDAVDLSGTDVDEQMQRLHSQVADYAYDEALITLQQLTDIYMNELKSESHGRA